MRATVQQKESSNKKWIIPLAIFIVSIIFEYFFGNILFFYSYDSIIGVQDFFNEKIGLSIFNNSYDPDEGKNKSDDIPNDIPINGSYFGYQKPLNFKEEKDIDEMKDFVKDADGNIVFSEIIHFFNTNTFFIMLCAITYNFANVYKIFVLTYSIFLGNFISSTLCFIFHSPRPYMVYYSIKPVIMFNDWGSPNTQVVVLTAFSLTFFEISIRNKKIEKGFVGKIIILIVIALIVFIDVFLLFASGNISYNQLIFSICIGIVTYQIIFLLFKAEVNKSKQLFDFLKFKTSYYLFINLILLAFQVVLSIFIIDKFDEDYYTEHIEQQQKRLFYSKFLNDNFNYRRHFYLNKGNFCDVCCFAMNIVAFLSVKLELFSKYKGDYDNWSSNNFEKPPQENGLLDVSEQDDYFIRDATQWNHTGFLKTFIRFFFILIFCIFSMIPSVLIYYLIKSSEADGYIFIIIVPMFLLVFGMFYLYKVILRCFKLIKKH